MDKSLLVEYIYYRQYGNEYSYGIVMLQNKKQCLLTEYVASDLLN